MAASSFVNPALLAIGQETLSQWLTQEPRLKIYEHFIANLFRKQAHVRSAEVEEVLGLLADPFEGTNTTADLLTSADLKFEAATSKDGAKLEVTQGSFDEILSGGDREARRTAFDSYTGKYLELKNTLAGNLGTSIKQNIFAMRARKHTSSLTASLFENNIPLEVFHNLINAFKKNLPTWHRYWQIRRKALGVDELQPYDIWAPLTQNPPRVPLEQAVEWICDGLAPLGEDYVRAVRQGCLKDRWVDVYPNKGKRSGAYSWGTHGTHPFIVMTYVDDIESLSTLAHELGHSMHSYLTWKHQPYVYSEYSLFAAEVASNFHQAMVRAHLLNTHTDRDFQINVITEAMSNFHRYFFIMPTLARFKLETHERIEKG
ncbi:MAG: M3 family oligoendopeptidase, partial [Chloroflexota bacterium]